MIRILTALILFPLFCFAQQWPYPPDNISTVGQNASEQQIAIAPDGTVVAVWVENGYVKARTNPWNGGWSNPTMTLSQSGASAPQIVVDATGNATALWNENGIIKSDVQSMGGNWSGLPVTISGSAATSASLSVDASGNVIAVWTENGFIKTATKLFSGSWPISPDIISSSGASHPQIGIGSDGTAMVVWQGLVNSTYTVYSATKPVSGSWGANQNISTDNVNSAYPQVVVDFNGTANVLWFRFNQNIDSQFYDVVLQHASKTVSGSWSTPVDISTAGMRDPADLVASIGCDDEGNTMALWTMSFDDSFFDIQWSIFVSGSWTSPLSIVNRNLLAFDVDMAFENQGVPFVAWMNLDDQGMAPIIQGSVSEATGNLNGFWKNWTLSLGGSNAYPFVVANKSGTNVYAAASWINHNGSNSVIQVLSAVFQKLYPPSNLSVTQQVNDFGVLSERYNHLSWQPSASSNIICYLIYRNGIFLSSVTADTLQFNDQNRKASETVTYSVSSCSDQGIESDVTTVVFNGS